MKLWKTFPGTFLGKYTSDMRWERFFEDIEHELESLDAAPKRSLEQEKIRLKRSKTTLHERILALELGVDISLQLVTGSIVRGSLENTGPDHIGIKNSKGYSQHPLILVPVQQISSLRQMPQNPTDSPSKTPQAKSIRSLALVLSALARRRLPIRINTIFNESINGTVSSVWADHIEFWVHEPDSSPRRGNVHEVRLLSFDSITLLSAKEPFNDLW